MSKQTQVKKRGNQRILMIAAGAALVLIAVVVLWVSSSSVANAAQDISPSAYQTQFVASSAAHLLIDVRTTEEFASGHIHGAVNIPVEELQDRLSEVSGDEPIVVYCHSGNRSAQAARILTQAGYTDLYDLGGVNEWTAQGFSLE